MKRSRMSLFVIMLASPNPKPMIEEEPIHVGSYLVHVDNTIAVKA